MDTLVNIITEGETKTRPSNIPTVTPNNHLFPHITPLNTYGKWIPQNMKSSLHTKCTKHDTLPPKYYTMIKNHMNIPPPLSKLSPSNTPPPGIIKEARGRNNDSIHAPLNPTETTNKHWTPHTSSDNTHGRTLNSEANGLRYQPNSTNAPQQPTLETTQQTLIVTQLWTKDEIRANNSNSTAYYPQVTQRTKVQHSLVPTQEQSKIPFMLNTLIFSKNVFYWTR